MIHTIKKGAITKLAVVVAVVITSITPYTHAELKQQLPQCRINTGKMPLQDERDVVAGEINDNGDVIVGGVRITNIGLSLEYQRLIKEIEGLEQDLKAVPLDKMVSRPQKGNTSEEKRRHVILGGTSITDIYLSLDYQQLLKEVEGLGLDLHSIPPEETESRLNKSKIVEEKRRQLLELRQEALHLAGAFSKIEINTERLKQAQQCFVQGKFREADDILKAEDLSNDQERILSTIESKRRELDELNQQLIGNANEFLIKAQTMATDPHNPDSIKDACRLYEQSIRSNMHFYTLFEYAYFLQRHNRYHEAERYYQDAINRYGGELDAPTRATMLNNIAALQSDKSEYENALKSYKESLGIYSELARSNPQTYLPSLAGTINHVAQVQYQKHDFDDAAKSYREALEVYRELARSNPQTYLPHVAGTINHLAQLQYQKNAFEDTLNSYREVLEVYRELARSHPQDYLAGVAGTLNRLADMQCRKGAFADALKSYQEALEIYRKLVQSNP
ncbi:MAG: tetratricopeptide repeat protein, partial [Planctomycetota bacterium]